MPSVRKALTACAPYLFVILFLLGTSRLVAPVNAALSGIATTVTLQGSLTFSWINTPGIWIFLSAFIGGWIQGARWKDFRIVFLETINQMKETILTIISVLACAKIMGYSGMIGDIASFAITVSGALYPLIAPWIGALGTFVTGSGTNSGVLFGAVQKQAAETLQVDPYWMVGLNSLGVAAGKMLGPQSLAIALSAVNEKGRDAELMKRIFPYTAAFLVLMSLFAWIGTMLFG
jgi:lactate permease